MSTEVSSFGCAPAIFRASDSCLLSIGSVGFNAISADQLTAIEMVLVTPADQLTAIEMGKFVPADQLTAIEMFRIIEPRSIELQLSR